ncbi:MAG: FG-GAP repeat protein, partial [Candidatus Marinimicrobia bacterium]|nr:FG-GAP repeat protein [Candidatus Neomarinimicrobiota bacterium]
MNVAKRMLFLLSILNLSFAAEHKLVASDPAMNDHLGISVAVSGDYAIVGAWEDDDNGTTSGSAYIFNRNPGTGNWVQTAKLLASDAAENDRFGCSVDMHGDYAIVGAYGNSHPSYGMGAAYIFQKDADSEDWLQRAKLVANDPHLGDSFGTSVAIDLDYALIGAPADDDVISESGSAYVFRRDEGLQSWSLKDKLTESNASQGAYFGNSVDLFEGYAIIGSHRGTSESALIFKKDTGAETWTEQAILIPSDWSADDEFGYAVAISADYAVVGARYEDYSGGDNAGAAYIFKRDTGLETWTEMTKLRASDVGSGG